MLNGVAVTSGCIAWAVGSYSDGAGARILIERFDGHRTGNGSPGWNHQFGGIATTSGNSWAVGFFAPGRPAEPGLVAFARRVR